MNALKRRRIVIVFAVATFLLANAFGLLETVDAQTAAAPKPAVQLNAALSLADNLTALKGRTVSVSLSSGQTLTGVVKEVQSHLLHLEKLSQKEFFDALIRLDQVIAVEVRAR